MSTGPEARLIAVAEAVADLTPVDWEGRMAETPELAGPLERLRQIASLERAHREAGARATEGTAQGGSLGPEAPVAGRSPGSEPALFRWGPLKVLERLDTGAFGEVFRAWEPALQREVALKLRPAGEEDAGARRWLSEARRLARVRHPNIVVVHGADVHDGRAGLWMDLVRGRTLESWLAEHGPMGAREAALVGTDLCAALAAVHAAGLIHGDIKSTNVMREESPAAGRIVLMDFGSAHEQASGAGGISAGTPLATAPEVLGGAPATPASDIYSLGVLLHRLVSGRYPVEAASREELRERLARGESASLRELRPDLPPAFVRAVERALEREPGDRFAGIGDLERALADSLEPRPAPAAPAAATARPRSFQIAIAAAVVVVAAATLLLTRPASPPGTAGRSSTTVPGDVASPLVGPTGAQGLDRGDGAPMAGATPTGGAQDAGPAAAVTPPRVTATFYRSREGMREPLADGAQVAPGDRLHLEIEGERALHVYVLNEDARGAAFLLFPLTGQTASNPLLAGRHHLPARSDGSALDWQVTSAGGRETFLIVASEAPLPSLEQALADFEPAREGRSVAQVELSPDALTRLRGVGGMAAAEPSTDRPGGKLAAVAQGLERSASRSPVWTRIVVLENPAP